MQANPLKMFFDEMSKSHHIDPSFRQIFAEQKGTDKMKAPTPDHASTMTVGEVKAALRDLSDDTLVYLDLADTTTLAPCCNVRPDKTTGGHEAVIFEPM